MANDTVGQGNQLLSRDELADWLGVKKCTLEQWTFRGEGPPWVKIGRLVRYRRADVEAWLDACRQPSDCKSKRD